MDRLKLAMASVVRTLLRRVDTTCAYRARVVAANGVRLDLRCDDPKVGDVTDVPLELGLPGVSFTFATLGYVLLHFEAGDPRRPFATLFDGGAFGTLVFLGPDGAMALARVGDVALAAWPRGMTVKGVLTSPSGSTSPLAGALTIQTPLVGVVTAGSGSVKA